MPHITLSVNNETYEQMKQFSDIKWSEVARRAIEKRIEELKLLEMLLNEEEMDDELKMLQNKIKSKVAEKHLNHN